MSLVVSVLYMVLSLAVVHRRCELVFMALDGMHWRQVTFDQRFIKVQIAVGHIAMEWLSVELVVLTRPMVSVNDRSFVKVPVGMESIASKILLNEVRVGEVVLFPMKRQHRLVSIVMFDTTGRLRLNLMEKLVIFMLDIAHESLSIMLVHIEIVIATPVVDSVEAAVLVVVALDLSAVVEMLAILLVMVRDWLVHPMVQHILLPRTLRLKERQIISFVHWVLISDHHLGERTVLMVHDLIALEPRMVIDIVLSAVLVGPKQLLVGGLVQGVRDVAQMADDL